MRKLLLSLLFSLCLTGCAASNRQEPDVSAMRPVMANVQEKAAAILDTLTREEILGQVFLVRSTGNRETAVRWAEEYHLGGYILFGQDFREETPDSVRDTIAAFQAASTVPMLVAVDEDGGTVVRASRYPAFREERFPSPQALFEQGGLEAVAADAREKSTFLKNLGINVNLAPVCDVSTDPAHFIYNRAFGRDAAATAEYVGTVVSAMTAQSVGSVLKHFPGYGGNVDTHTGIAVDQRPLDQFLQEDLLPFRSGIQAGAGGVMISHNIIACLDASLPASLSPAIYKLLRSEVGFEGVAITDDLDMAAVAAYVQEGNAVIRALSAGADMVILSDPQVQIPQVQQALQSGQLSWERLREGALRVLIWKLELGLISN
jgi:beta-N-acetylhexosaminidase